MGVDDVIVITVPFDINRCSPNRYKRNWRAKAAEAKAARTAGRIAWCLAGKPRAAGPVDVYLLIRRGRVIDGDNAIACLKHIGDAFFNDGVTPYDSAEWVRYVAVEQETGAEWRLHPEVVVTIRHRGE